MNPKGVLGILTSVTKIRIKQEEMQQTHLSTYPDLCLKFGELLLIHSVLLGK